MPTRNELTLGNRGPTLKQLTVTRFIQQTGSVPHTMAIPKTVISDHPQIQPKSCVAWGIEVVLQIFDKPLPYPTVQTATPNCGFGNEVCKMLEDDYGLLQTQKTYEIDFVSLKRDVLLALGDGAAVLVILPSAARPNPAGGAIVDSHTYTAYEVNGELYFGTRTGVGSACPAECLTAAEFDLRRIDRTVEVIAAGGTTVGLLHTMFVKPR